ncbi:hypothetical protein SCLCIDRAFT_165988 [Scleroderma citrinum Foug A]|uniref:Uncharacterized protein n=1 Tax=Scleroderma citrinum Foug A TaxID=1036808 RepID=A0A0C3EDI0_9AGAM|nr:hypothetical protein SCLCIDRAFT_165988 [Scleroderma citrinum Foug A]
MIARTTGKKCCVHHREPQYLHPFGNGIGSVIEDLNQGPTSYLLIFVLLTCRPSLDFMTTSRQDSVTVDRGPHMDPQTSTSWNFWKVELSFVDRIIVSRPPIRTGRIIGSGLPLRRKGD